MNETSTSAQSGSVPAQARIIDLAEHGITADKIGENARWVLTRLEESGFEAYAVGGCVRDLLLGRKPKDFDIVTNARPEEVKRLFRFSRIIGRRFRIVHVIFHGEVIEVTTFRGGDADQIARGSEGMITRDNVFGRIDEDVFRRDFGCNALYYHPGREQIVDFVDGVADINARRLHMIGDVTTRFAEDPVRMLRAARFAAKLDFKPTAEVERGVRQCRDLLTQVAPARLYDETIKLLQGGQGVASLFWLQRLDLLEPLFPELDQALKKQPEGIERALIDGVLQATDNRVANNLPVNPAFLLAGLFWRRLCAAREHWLVQRVPPDDALILAADEVLAQAARNVMIPRRLADIIRSIWALQSELEHHCGQTGQRWRVVNADNHTSTMPPENLTEAKWFRAAVDFLCLRAQAGELSESVCSFWRQYAPERGAQDEPVVAALTAEDFGKGKPRRRNRRRSRRRG